MKKKDLLSQKNDNLNKLAILLYQKLFELQYYFDNLLLFLNKQQ